MNVEEIPLVFECQGDALVGIVHRPEQSLRRGVLAVVAGGPQFRGGCCRQLVLMARDLSSRGIPVMRFDYRGMGDSGGAFRGFQHIEDDLRAAIDLFMATVPGMKEIVLWGGCDAASAIMIHGHRFPVVTGMILGNPYAHTEATEAAVTRQYYLQRLRDKAFWAKVIKLRFNPLKIMRSVWCSVRGVSQHKARATHATSQGEAPFTERMLHGFKQFPGRVLLLMSGLSLTSQEFDVLVATSPAWRKAAQAAHMERIDIANADQTFSTFEARDAMIAAAKNWLLNWK